MVDELADYDLEIPQMDFDQGRYNCAASAAWYTIVRMLARARCRYLKDHDRDLIQNGIFYTNDDSQSKMYAYLRKTIGLDEDEDTVKEMDRLLEQQILADLSPIHTSPEGAKEAIARGKRIVLKLKEILELDAIESRRAI